MNTTITTQRGLNKINFLEIEEIPFWNTAEEEEIRMHKIHVYPAKFPSLIAQKAFEYARRKIRVNTVADIFCGCGTVAVEARRKGINFWGCDINPVAVLIAQAKTANYDVRAVQIFEARIIERVKRQDPIVNYDEANARIVYWFYEAQYNDLARLKNAIMMETQDDEYRKLFLCIFSSILKGTSKWLTKSIKPQIDPNKRPSNVIEQFGKQMRVVIRAITEAAYSEEPHQVNILHQDVLTIEQHEFADMIVTSPPYVTSYEYADLHQLSALWLNYAEDHTELRRDSIGSSYGTDGEDYQDLLPTAKKIVDYFTPGLSQARSVARYYDDMRKFAEKSYEILVPGGIAVFVIGDTELKERHIENAKCLCEAMIECGYTIREISKRKVQNKFLPSHRGKDGKFSSDKKDRAIYSQEYIIIGRKG